MDLSRQQIIKMLRRAGLDDLADQAEATLPDQVESTTMDQFCTAQGVSPSVLMDRMGASP